jgi:hypothetical protein
VEGFAASIWRAKHSPQAVQWRTPNPNGFLLHSLKEKYDFVAELAPAADYVEDMGTSERNRGIAYPWLNMSNMAKYFSPLSFRPIRQNRAFSS